MSRVRFAPGSFMVGFCCGYVLAFAKSWPLFWYYPLHGNFTWGNQLLKGIGPAMAWYGLMCSAAIIGIVAALLLPQQLMERLLRNAAWLFPVAAMLSCVFLLRKFFGW